MTRFEDYLTQSVARYPDKTAVVCGDESCSYRQLDEQVTARAAQWRETLAHDTGRNIVCLRALSTIDYLIDYLAIHRAGYVAAPLEKDMPDDVFQRVKDELERHTAPEGTADILYTTGTTGRSKGVMVSHRAIIADAENLIAGQGFTHDLVFVVNGPLNHIGSLSKIYPVIYLGATLIIVDGMKDLNAFFHAFDYPAKKMATFLVPASIRILIQLAGKRLAAYAEKIDFVETGAAAISQADMDTLCRLLPHSRLYNTYASTETGIICTYDFNSGQCLAGCLGRPMPHSDIFITGQGLIACKGDTLMTGYIGDPERTSSVLKDGVIYTSDMGQIDEEDRLHLRGREDDVINIGGFKVAPTEVEDAVMAFEGVRDCVCIPVEHRIMGTALKMLVVMNDGCTLDKRTLARWLKTRLETYKIPLLYEQVEAVKRTFNGKIDRKHYSEGEKGR
ncbi:MAG: acyl--CoA ligase [Prevotella sp.]|nr:acyl--CoA ligase [Prevotella sp.]